MNAHGKLAKASTSTAAIKVLTGSTAIMAEIKAFAMDATTMQNRLHTLACSVLAHIGKHGDKRPVAAMLDAFDKAVPDMVKRNALRAWLEAFGKVRFVDGNVAYDGSKPQKLGEAMEKPFWKFKSLEGVKYQPLVMDDYLDRQIKALRLDATKTNRDHTTVIAALVALRKATVETPAAVQ